jgi:hypothetical protein
MIQDLQLRTEPRLRISDSRDKILNSESMGQIHQQLVAMKTFTALP